MYLTLSCSFAIAAALCYIASMILRIVNVPLGIIILAVLAIIVIFDTLISKRKKTYCSMIAAIISVVIHLIIAKENVILGKDSAIGLFLLLLSLFIAYSYRTEHTLGNAPIYHDAVFGKRAGEISAAIQFAFSLLILHSMIYINSIIYAVICFVSISFISVIAAQIIIYPEYKEYKIKEKQELEVQIKKEQGYR